MDLFSPFDFTNIKGYPHNFPPNFGEIINEVPLFQDVKAISAESHLQHVNLCISKRFPYTDSEDVKMQLFIFTLGNDLLDWFLEFPDNTFYSLQSIINAFKDKYGDKGRFKAKVEAKEIKEDENGLIQQLTQMIKDMQLNQPHVIKNMEVDQAQLIKNMELNQTRLIVEHAREMSAMKDGQIAL